LFSCRVDEAESPLSTEEGETRTTPIRYNIEFTFDCDARCAFTIYYFATEEITNGQLV